MSQTIESRQSPGRIRQLSASVINKIAAGEVIERPASVVKELMENSVDAGATRIDVSIGKGGAEWITVTDDGGGIEPEDLMLAVTSHATSKIVDADDLFAVGTMGFRGEALASIAEVSQMKIRSRTSSQETGFELLVGGGKAEPIVPCGCGRGTTIEVANLFFNTPVRQKFMRTTQTEMGHITEAFTRIALPNPQIHMTLRHNQRIVHELPATQNWVERIRGFFGEEITHQLIAIESENDGVRLRGYVANPNVSRANNKMQYLFLNRRHIRDRSLQHALSEAYRGLLMGGRYPVTFLQLEMPPQVIDVNVHPAKLEVRFQDGGKLYSQLLGAIRNKFLTTDLTSTRQAPAVQEPRPHPPSDSMANWSREHLQSAFQPPAESTSQGQIPFATPTPSRDWVSAPRTPGPEHAGGVLEQTRDLPGSDLLGHSVVDAQDAVFGQNSDLQVGVPAGKNYRALQIHNRYLVTENEEGMVVIDQHALHERVLYEQIREKVLAGKLETQRLLVPEPVSLTAAEAALVLEHQETLREIGIEIENFGGDSVLVSGYPAMLRGQNPAEMLRGVVDLLQNEGKRPERRDVVDSLLHMISCKAAIKAGDRLTGEEIEDLLRYRDICQDAHHCPHGRPTSLVFSRNELDKRFKRI